eukprot:TRINITY_DN1532_c0_g2_i19.p1 TRINITY_DN1532_c0_g2~~TRINITY_DN1532_c0_g2_i19.p1  ORF type:complete len:205 (+),score=35.75 TRINITY_DN1532_c0_g2_i19:162-776(+)
MNEPLNSAPEDNIYLEIKMKDKGDVAPCCNILCIICFLLNIAAIFLIPSQCRLAFEVVSAEVFAWSGTLTLLLFMFCKCASRTSMAAYIIVIVVSCAIPVAVLLLLILNTKQLVNFIAYLALCVVRVVIFIYMIPKIKILRGFDEEINKIKRRIKMSKRKRQVKSDVAILPKMIETDEEVVFNYTCTSGFRSSIISKDDDKAFT